MCGSIGTQKGAWLDWSRVGKLGVIAEVVSGKHRGGGVLFHCLLKLFSIKGLSHSVRTLR